MFTIENERQYQEIQDSIDNSGEPMLSNYSILHPPFEGMIGEGRVSCHPFPGGTLFFENHDTFSFLYVKTVKGFVPEVPAVRCPLILPYLYSDSRDDRSSNELLNAYARFGFSAYAVYNRMELIYSGQFRAEPFIDTPFRILYEDSRLDDLYRLIISTLYLPYGSAIPPISGLAGGRCHSVADAAGRTVTAVSIKPAGRSSACFYHLATDAGFRKRGLASALLRQAMRYEYDLYGTRFFSLWVEAGNTGAASCYRRIGFEDTGKHIAQYIYPALAY